MRPSKWARIEPFLPGRTLKRGGRWRDHREVIDAIASKFQTGTQWVRPPQRCGNWRGIYSQLRVRGLPAARATSGERREPAALRRTDPLAGVPMMLVERPRTSVTR
ncbi:transposase [Streptomyces ambofaciens]